MSDAAATDPEGVGRPLAWWAWGVVSVVNLLDLLSATYPPPFEIAYVPERSSLQWSVQAVVLLLSLPWLAGCARSAGAWLSALPIPRGPAIILSIWMGVALGHVVLQVENYPFSYVGMFSVAVEQPRSPVVFGEAWTLDHGDWVEQISFMREGSPWFRQHLELDYKAGWLLRMHGHTHPAAEAWVRASFVERGLPEPQRIRIAYDRATGAVHYAGDGDPGRSGKGEP